MQKPAAPPRRPWDWPSAILVFLMVQVAAARLVITGWTPNLYFTQTLSAISVALGLALGYSNFRPRTVRWLAWLYSLVILPWQMVSAAEIEAPFSERLFSVGGRLLYSTVEFFSRKPVEDALFFVALVSLGFWIIGLTAGYALARNNNTLGALLPAGFVLARGTDDRPNAPTAQEARGGIASGVRGGVAGGVATAVAGGPAKGVAGAIAEGVEGGVYAGIAGGVTRGVAGGVLGGIGQGPVREGNV